MTQFLDLWVQYAPLMLAGLVTTAWICALATVLGIVVGLVLACLDGIAFEPLRWAVRVYVEFMRGLPILILLFVLYYGGPSIGLRLGAQTVGVLGLGFYGGAYFAEIFRSGFQSIPKGQIEAARIAGLTGTQIIRHIKLPQMLVLITPAIVNQIIILIKESAVLSIITVAELTKNTTQFVNETYAVIQPYVAAAVLYWLLVEAVAQLGKLVERRVKF
ncbi:amino acid ABC transporter permease [Mesorhizobium sp. CA13]|uniref:amino acid ABC transporter permease n=2 Tax=Mesorhizobium TaxID=68287 RepID=UPI00112CF912|nr:MULTISPECIES: amino acid ABC transporter permease [unclassified Mesorhizobium]MBZ9856519.1 amino acid ABC transporter permease [Mesorhizobium sp. CA13]MBZ9965734.1 amino acid ABC transporter permease [Mesorhizobium sp. BR1-1-2]TPM44156.1 amino acid ABC transporter permease [Mesorhizobium sp. B2-3-2]